MIIVKSPTDVSQDGVTLGKVADAIANNKTLAPAIQKALEEFVASKDAEIAELRTQIAPATE